MSKYIGRLLNLGLGRESSRGVGVSPTYLLPRTKFTFDDKIVQARSVGSLGYLADSEESFVTTKYGQGELEGEVRDKSFGLILYSMLGSLSTSGPTDSSYSHTFTVSNSNQHQSLSFLASDPNTTELYKLVMLDSLELTAELDQILMFNAGFMSKQSVGSSATQATLTAENKFTKKHLQFRIASNLAGLGAASTISLKKLTFKVSKNVMLDDVLGTAEPEDILNQQLSVEGELELNYEDETYKNYMKNGTSKAVEIKFVNTDATIGASTNPSLTIQLPKVDFYDWEPDYSNDKIVTQKISFKASRDVSGGNNIISSAVLVNSVASY